MLLLRRLANDQMQQVHSIEVDPKTKKPSGRTATLPSTDPDIPTSGDNLTIGTDRAYVDPGMDVQNRNRTQQDKILEHMYAATQPRQRMDKGGGVLRGLSDAVGDSKSAEKLDSIISQSKHEQDPMEAQAEMWEQFKQCAADAASKGEKQFMFAGKTGSSQVKRFTALQRELEIKQKDIVYKDRDHALFVAFAPYADPKYAISVVVEHGGTGSSSAAPIAKKVIKKVLERDKLRENIQNLTGEEI